MPASALHLLAALDAAVRQALRWPLRRLTEELWSDVPLVVGVDFDNTVAGYDALFHALALERALVGPGTPPTKTAVRDAVRALPDGDLAWQRLQGAAYGPLMHRAVPLAGVVAFFRRCRARGVPAFIVSHKTCHANLDETRTDLRAAAVGWLREHAFFDPAGPGLAESAVHFTATRAEKLLRIRDLGCTHFVDDLAETFLEPAFPAGVERLLLDPHGEAPRVPLARRFAKWTDLDAYLLGAR